MEEAVNELKMANLTVHKLGEAFDSFQSHAFSISALSEQWRALKGSFAVVESSLLNRVKEIESKERTLVATEKRIENLEREVELKRKRVDERAIDVKLSEKKICDGYEVVKMREKDVMAFFERKEKELIARFDEKETAIDVRSKAVEVKEKELTERFERCSRELEEKRTVVDQRSRDLEVKEKDLTKNFEEKVTAINERSKCLELKEKKMIESFQRDRKEFEVECEEKKLGIDERLKELELKEKEMNERFKELEVLELREKEIDERVRVLVSKDTKLNGLIDKYNVKAEQVDKQVLVMESKERELNERIDEYNVKVGRVDEQARVMALKERELNERIHEYNVKVGRVDEQARVMASKLRELNEHIDEYNVKVRRVDEGWKDIEVKEKQIVRRRKIVELKEKDLDDKLRGCELRMEENDQFCRELDSKERELEERSKMLESKEKEMNEQCEALELIKKENDEHSKMLDLKEIELKQDSKKCKVNGSYICERLNTLCRDMDANGLLSYLNERVNDHNELHDEVLDALRFTSSPSKLVLDACKTFHGPYSAKLVINNNQTSCIYLMELFMKLESEVTSDVSNEARKFADVWRSRLNKCDDSPWGNFGFLLFLAAFKLSGLYEVKVIAEHLARLYSEEDIYQAEKHVAVCSALGIADNIPDIIQNRIDKHRPLEALRLAHVFELFHKFPPVPLLESYLSSTFTKAEKVRRRQDPSKEAQIKYLTTKIGALNFVVRCIKKYDLMSKFPIQPLENLSVELKREKLGLTRVSSLDSETKSLTASAGPYSNVASGFTSLTPCRAMKNEVRSHDFVGLSETSGSMLDARPQNMSRNKRQRFFSIQRPEPVNPHLVIPASNRVAVPSYCNYTCWPFNSHQSLPHP